MADLFRSGTRGLQDLAAVLFGLAALGSLIKKADAAGLHLGEFPEIIAKEEPAEVGRAWLSVTQLAQFFTLELDPLISP